MCDPCRKARNIEQKRRREKKRAEKGYYKYDTEIAWDYARKELGRRNMEELEAITLDFQMKNKEMKRDVARTRALVVLANKYREATVELQRQFLARETKDWKIKSKIVPKPDCNCLHSEEMHRTRSGICRILTCKCRVYRP